MKKILKRIVLSSALILFTCGGKVQLDLYEKNIIELQALMTNGELTSVQLVKYFQQRIEKYDTGEKGLHAIIMVNPDALDIASQLDKERSAKGSRGPLHGIPVLLKDNIDTADKMPNTAGSLLLKENFPKQDALLVTKLRAAGAVILGKANLSEWANFRGMTSSSGWSAIGGQVLNPYREGANPCGSSSGSAVSVAADLVTVSVGTETDGSLTCPAAINGIVTIKPTLGVISQQGIIPISHNQDTAGPMGRSVVDVVFLLDAMAEKPANYSVGIKREGLQGKRIGVVRNLMGYNSKVDAIFDTALNHMAQQGAKLIDSCDIPTVGKYSQDEYAVLLTEFKAGINKYLLGAEVDGIENLQDLIAGNIRLADKELIYFGQEIFISAQQSPAETDKTYLKAVENAKRLAGQEGIDAALASCNVDLLVAPTTGPAWQTDYKSGDDFSGSASQPAAVAGYPHISVPMGYVDGLPVGISFFGSANQEVILIETAYGYEQATQHRQPPMMDWVLGAHSN